PPGGPTGARPRAGNGAAGAERERGDRSRRFGADRPRRAVRDAAVAASRGGTCGSGGPGPRFATVCRGDGSQRADDRGAPGYRFVPLAEVAGGRTSSAAFRDGGGRRAGPRSAAGEPAERGLARRFASAFLATAAETEGAREL